MPIVTGFIAPMDSEQILRRLRELDQAPSERFVTQYIVRRWRFAEDDRAWRDIRYMCHGAGLAIKSNAVASDLYMLAQIAQIYEENCRG